MTSWIISDLHLSAQRPAVTQAFLHWLRNEVSHAQALYILGDFFEVWVGDDVLEDAVEASAYWPVVESLRQLSACGVQISLMHGNRDFLLGQRFAAACGLQLLPDPILLSMAGKNILLSHGDALCTDDHAYQQFRSQVRDRNWQQQFLAQPLSARLAFAAQARDQSRQNKAMQAMDIMDVNQAAVADMLRQYDYPDVLLHGHTHRPAIHRLLIEGHACERWVLGDWHATAEVVKVTAQGLEKVTLTLSDVS